MHFTWVDCVWGMGPRIFILIGFSDQANAGVPLDHTLRNWLVTLSTLLRIRVACEEVTCGSRAWESRGGYLVEKLIFFFFSLNMRKDWEESLFVRGHWKWLMDL